MPNVLHDSLGGRVENGSDNSATSGLSMKSLYKQYHIPYCSVEVSHCHYEGTDNYCKQIQVADSFELQDCGQGSIKNFINTSITVAFKAFDSFVEQKYYLQTGASFRQHYKGLPQLTALDKIQKSTYRIGKLIRNAFEHNEYSVCWNRGVLSSSYLHNKTQYNIEITKKSIEYLFTLFKVLVDESISGC